MHNQRTETSSSCLKLEHCLQQTPAVFQAQVCGFAKAPPRCFYCSLRNTDSYRITATHPLPFNRPIFIFSNILLSQRKTQTVLIEDAGDSLGCTLPDGNAVTCPCNLWLRVWFHHTDKLGHVLYQCIHGFQRSADQGSCMKEEKVNKPPHASRPFGKDIHLPAESFHGFSPHTPSCLLQILYFPLFSLNKVQNRET